jgi:hypothetical protein
VTVKSISDLSKYKHPNQHILHPRGVMPRNSRNSSFVHPPIQLSIYPPAYSSELVFASFFVCLFVRQAGAPLVTAWHRVTLRTPAAERPAGIAFTCSKHTQRKPFHQLQHILRKKHDSSCIKLSFWISSIV